MDINNGTNSRQLGFLSTYLDDWSMGVAALMQLAQKLNTPEEVARSPEFSQMTQQKRIAFHPLAGYEISIDDIVQIMKRYE